MSRAIRRVSVRNLAAHKVRLLLTTVSVLLGTAFVAGSFVFTDTLKSSFDKIFANAYEGVDSRVQPAKDWYPGVPFSVADQVKALPGVAKVAPEVTAPVVLINSDGKKVPSGGAPSEGGMWLGAGESISEPPEFASGRAPSAPGEVVVNEGAAEKGNLHTGDRARVVLPNAEIVDVTISGIYRTDTETGGYVGVRFVPDQATRLLTDGHNYSAVNIAGAPGVSEKELTARVAALLASTLEAHTGTQVRDDVQSDVQTALSFVTYILLAFGLIALIVGTFIIYNTFSMIVAQRVRELALLRAVGADRKQIRRAVLLEAAIIGSLGSVLGIAGGIGLAYALHALLQALDLGLPTGGLVLTTRTIVVAVLIGTMVTLLSAYAPARRASKIPPVAAMREEHASASAHSLHRRTALGAVLAAIGALFTVNGALTDDAGTAASLIGLGLFGVGAGAMLLSPVLAGWVISPLGRLIGRPFGSIGRLARTNAVRNPRRTAATGFALTLGLLLVSGIAVIGASMKATINDVLDNNVHADYILFTQTEMPVPLPAARAASEVDGVESLTELHEIPALVDGKHDWGSGVDGPLTGVLDLEVTEGVGEPTGRGMLVSTDTADEKGWALGSRHALSVPGRGAVTVTIAGIYQKQQELGPWMVSGDVYRELTPRNDWSDVVAFVKAEPGADLDRLGAELNRVTNDYAVVEVNTREEFKGAVASQVNAMLGLLYGLLGLAIVIAILGIVNTLALSVVERRREIGMLRAVGMLRKQVRRAIYLESMLIAVFGATLGLVLGLTYGSLFTHTLADQGLNRLSVPWGQAITFLVVAAVVGVLAALWPGIRAARTRPLEAIAEA